MAFGSGFGGFANVGGNNLRNQMALYLQQQNDQATAQATLSNIGYVPQGGPTNTHGNVNQAVNLAGAETSVQTGLLTSHQPAWVEGLGVDLNGDGNFKAGQDGFLALDLDGNGVYNQNDVKDTLQMLRLFSGDSEASSVETPAFGSFNQAEQAKTALLKARGKQADLNQDGVLSGWELSKMGAKVLVKGQSPYSSLEHVQAHNVPGAYTPDYQPRTPYYPQPTTFGGHSPYAAPMNFGPPAYFMQVLQSMFSMLGGGY